MPSPLAKKIVKSIVDDISGRRGLGDEWDQCDSGVKSEIRKSWGDIIDRIQSTPPDQK